MRMVGTSIAVIKFYHNNKRQNHRILCMECNVLSRCAHALWPPYLLKQTKYVHINTIHIARNKIKLPFNSRHRESNCQPSMRIISTKEKSFICNNNANKDFIHKTHTNPCIFPNFSEFIPYY